MYVISGFITGAYAAILMGLVTESHYLKVEALDDAVSVPEQTLFIILFNGLGGLATCLRPLFSKVFNSHLPVSHDLFIPQNSAKALGPPAQFVPLYSAHRSSVDFRTFSGLLSRVLAAW